MTYSLEWLKKPELGYRRVFYFMGPNHVLSNLANKRVKLSSFEKCNDVFELASFSLDEGKSRRKHREWTQSINDKVGLVCLSTDWKNPLMWAHYADRGQGVCLVIDVSEETSTPVKYLSARKRTNAYDFPAPTSQNFREFCSTKSIKWRYEKEVRVLSNYSDTDVLKDGNLRFLKFSKRFKLVGAINGPKPALCCDELIEAGINASYFFQSRPAFTKFEVVSQQKKELWKRCVQ